MTPSPEPLFDSKAFLSAVTHQSGVYRMYDSGGTVIYVGKAKDLKKRLASYFRANVDSIKTRTLVRQIADVQVTVTHTETEALILEHNLIKQYQPRYNVLLRDDKSYPWIIITDHQHPRIGVHRGARKVKGEYFGPYPSGGAVRESLHLMQKIFPVRQCEDAVYANRTRPCLLYQLKRCAGPCVAGLVSEAEYAQQVALAKLFLAGKNQQVIGELVGKMESASGDLRFEEAARYRDQIQALRRVTEQQSVSGNVLDELDVVGVAFEQGTACIHVLFIRQGKVLGSRSYFPKVPADTPLEEVVQSFLLQFYLSGQGGRQIPSEVLLDVALEDESVIADTLSQTAGYRVRVVSRTRSERARFIKLAAINAQTALRSRLAHKSTITARYDQLENCWSWSVPSPAWSASTSPTPWGSAPWPPAWCSTGRGRSPRNTAASISTASQAAMTTPPWSRRWSAALASSRSRTRCRMCSSSTAVSASCAARRRYWRTSWSFSAASIRSWWASPRG